MALACAAPAAWAGAPHVADLLAVLQLDLLAVLQFDPLAAQSRRDGRPSVQLPVAVPVNTSRFL
jgi:hypothetical protein